MKRIRFTTTLVAIAITASSTLASAAMTRGPYLQLATPHSITIVWRTSGEIEPIVRYGTSVGELEYTLDSRSIHVRASKDVRSKSASSDLYSQSSEVAEQRSGKHDASTPAGTFQFEATISGLEPNRLYYYAIYDGLNLLTAPASELHFKTLPSESSSEGVRIWVVGDSGTGGEEQAAVHQAMRDFAQKSGRAIDHFLHVGDMAYRDGTDKEFQEHFFEPYQATLRNTVVWPAMGNHEGRTSRGLTGTGPYYDAYVLPAKGEAGGVPSGTEAYYSFDIGNIHFVCLDSHDLDRDPNAAMAQWLSMDLAATQADWLIAFWHHPPYTKGSHDSDRELQLIEMRENFMPILESAGVDLTLTGHSHIYERSMLIDGAYATPTTASGVVLNDGDGHPESDGAYRKSKGLHPNEGSVSIVAGHGGAGLGREGTMPIMREIILEHGSVIIDIHGDTLESRMINDNGEVRDLFTIVKKGKVTPSRIVNPWQPLDDPALYTTVLSDFRKAFDDRWPARWSSQSDTGLIAKWVPPSHTSTGYLEESGGTIGSTRLFSIWNLDEFDMEALIRMPRQSDSASLIFGYIDQRNFLKLTFSPAESSVKLEQVSDGNSELIEQKTAAIAANDWLEVGIEGVDHTLEIEYQSISMQDYGDQFPVQLSKRIPKGKLGYQLPAGSSLEIQWIEVQDESH